MSETRFTRVTDTETTPIIEATAVEASRRDDEEDLSVGPGNVAQPFEVARKRTRRAASAKTATPTRKAAAKTAKAPRAPRPRKNARKTDA